MKGKSFCVLLDAGQQAELRRIVATGNYVPQSVPHALLAARGRNCTLVLYRSGKFLIQGRGAPEWVEFVLEPLILKAPLITAGALPGAPAMPPHMGVDESGKGDYFGPLAVAAVYLDGAAASELAAAGVRDSKQVAISKVRPLARLIRQASRGAFSVVPIGPEAYNRMYATLGNVNRLLAWGHARAIENVLGRAPECTLALADQFGPVHRIQDALMKKGRSIELQQRPRAESDTTVAAASILARESFLVRLEHLGKEAGQELPRGCGAGVRETAVTLVKRLGPEILPRIAKMHFRTTEQVLQTAGAVTPHATDSTQADKSEERA